MANARWVSTVTALQAETGMSLGEIAIMAGYSVVGDGGGGILYFNTTVPASQTITAATWATPIEITTSANHGLVNGQRAVIDGVAGNTAANGTWRIELVAGQPTKFTLIGSVGNGNRTSGGWIGDGGSTFPTGSTTAGLWARIANPKHVIPITDFGPLTSGTEVYDAIVAALPYLASIGGGTLFFPQRASNYDVLPPGASGLTVSVHGTNRTFTRASGSFVTDGFRIGQKVSWSGFSTAANNIQGAEIIAIGGSGNEIMTVSSAVSGLQTENNAPGTAAWVPIELSFDDLTFELAPGVDLANASTTGADFFRTGGTGIRTRLNFCGGRIRSDSAAGHVFTFAKDIGLGRCTWTSEIVQLNVNKSILYRDATATDSGLFTNVFAGPQWQHGSGDAPGGSGAPKVPAVFMQSSLNMLNENSFVMQKTDSHHGEAPFFWLVNDTTSGGAYWTRNKIDIGSVERCSFGFIYAAGHLGLTVGRLGVYDLDGTYGHLVETATGNSGTGRANEQCLFDDIEVISVGVSGGLDVGGVRGPRKVATITSVGTTATLTSTGHGFKVGDWIFVRGANEGDYNGRFQVATADANTLTYTMLGDPASPATGTITVAKGSEWKATITSSGTRATATLTPSGHPFVVGQRIFVEGANEAAYKGRFTVLAKTSTTVTYEMTSDPVDTATGTTLSVAEAAMTIKIGSGDFRHTFGHIGGNSDPNVEVDTNNCSAFVHAEQSRCLYARVSPSLANRGLIGSGARFDTPKVRAPTGYIDAMKLAWVSNSQVSVGTGSCRSDDDSYEMSFGAAVTADLSTSGANGLDTGSEAANTNYSVWAVADSITGVTAVLLSTSATSPTMPSGYDKKRRMGWIRNNNSSNIRPFFQYGNGRIRDVYYDAALSELNALSGGSAGSFTDINLTARVPSTSQFAHLLVALDNSGGAASDALHLRPKAWVNADGPWTIRAGAVLAAGNRLPVSMPTDSTQRVQYFVDDATNDTADVWVIGYRDEL